MSKESVIIVVYNYDRIYVTYILPVLGVLMRRFLHVYLFFELTSFCPYITPYIYVHHAHPFTHPPTHTQQNIGQSPFE